MFSTLKKICLSASLLMGMATLLPACSKDSPSDNNTDDGNYSYVVFTNEGDLGTPGYMTAYTKMPTGDFSNIQSKTLQMGSAFGFTKYGNWIFNRTSIAGQAGIQKLTVGPDGSIQDAGFLANGSMFLVVSPEQGYYSDESRGTMLLQTFNPTTMTRTGQIDLSELSMDGVPYQVVGKHILAAKEGKLYASVTYSSNANGGYGDDVVNYAELAVIDIATNKLEKTIQYPGIKSFGWGSSANKFWTLGDDGALYLYYSGFNEGITNSSIVRIKKGETDFDKEWILKADDFQPHATIAGALIKNGKIYIQLPEEPLTADFKNLADYIWDYYAVDINTLEKTKITGMPKTRYIHSNDQGITEIDGKIYLWLANGDQNGYYQLNTETNEATKAFNVTDGGLVSGFIHLDSN